MYQNILSDTSAYQYIANMFRDEAHKKGFAEGRAEGQAAERQARVLALRKVLLMIVQSRFPRLVSVAEKQANRVSNIDILEEMTGKVGSARTLSEARRALSTWRQADYFG